MKSSGFYVVKVIVGNRSGIPDIIACKNGRFIGIEVKALKGVVSVLQDVNLRQIRDAGGVSIILREGDDFKAILSAI